ncbi:gephyrin-like molybdotransferase receptor GlpR [Actinophytocola sp.]|uniref:divisome protein SepX/GlpR n=1 Tax=Actinophytocola sp. TaxID=1872138 RepID=UPI00389A90F9
MPSSLVVVALVVAWLVVLVPMIVRKRQEVAKTGDSELAARVVRSGSAEAELDLEEAAVEEDEEIREDLAGELVAEVTDISEEVPDDDADQDDMSYYDDGYPRQYRPGRGGFDPEAAAVIARAKYAFRQRVVLAMIVGAILTAVGAAVVFVQLWWAHGFIDVVLVSYLVYLRRQVRIENEIRERRLARMQRVRRAQAAHAAQAEAYARAAQYAAAEEPAHEPRTVEEYVEEIYHHDDEPTPRERVVDEPPAPPVYRGNAVVVDVDDEDPVFSDLQEPGNLPYRRAAGE